MNYPKEQRKLLEKAGLLMHGKVLIRALRTESEEIRSEDGEVWERVKRVTGDDTSDPIRSFTFPVRDRYGKILGNWTNNVTTTEAEILHKECGIPYFYVNNQERSNDGSLKYPDTKLDLFDMQELDLSDPKDVAFFSVVVHSIGMIGSSKAEAEANGAMFYFFSKVEEDKREKEELESQLQAVDLIREASPSRKQQIVKYLSYTGVLMTDPYIGIDNAVMAFDKACLRFHKEVLEAHRLRKLEEHIIIHTLKNVGEIESESLSGPFYLNPDVYKNRTHLADDFDELVAKIHNFPQLIASYNKMQETVLVVKDEKVVESSFAKKLLAKHAIKKTDSTESQEEEVAVGETVQDEDAERESQIKATKTRLNFLSVEKLLDLFHDEKIDHGFDERSDAKEMRQFYIDHTFNA